jgi:hypothetical protein
VLVGGYCGVDVAGCALVVAGVKLQVGMLALEFGVAIFPDRAFVLLLRALVAFILKSIVFSRPIFAGF